MDEEKFKKAFISYLNDDNKLIEGWFDNVIIKDGAVSFDTLQHRIIIPISRIKKIKGDIDESRRSNNIS